MEKNCNTCFYSDLKETSSVCTACEKNPILFSKWIQRDVYISNTNKEGGKHYLDMPMQPWDLMKIVLSHDEFIGYLKGNIIKYSMRAGKKEGTDDIAKARHYKQKLEEVEAEHYGSNF